LYTIPKRGPDIWPLFKLGDGILTNRFPDMREYCFKSWMYSRLAPYLMKYSQDFSFIPFSWDFSNPIEYKQFLNQFQQDSQKTYILKPSEGSQGLRIALAQTMEQINEIVKGHQDEQSLTIAQEYISSPKLLNGYKFDFRVYVLIERLEPFTVHIFREALTRFSTSQYVSPNKNNMLNTCMHLTNYYLNRDNEQWKESDSKEDQNGTKRLISITLDQLYESSLADNKENKEKKIFSKEKFWKDLDEIIGKSLFAYYPDLVQSYKKIFENKNQESESNKDGKKTMIHLQNVIRSWVLICC